MRKVIFPALLVVALALAACGTHALPPGAQTGTPDLFQSLLHRAGVTLCPVGHIDPALQGGSETIDIYSFSANTTCSAGATARQGLIYFVQNVDAPSTVYFLRLAAFSGFLSGWRSENLAIVTSKGVPALRLLAIAELFKHHATPIFGVSRQK
jgi:hypothetical protein